MPVIQKALGGVEDLLFGQGTVDQLRGNTTVPISKINAETIPYTGDDDTGDKVSVFTAIQATTQTADSALQDASEFATAAQGALADSALQDASAFATVAQGALADSAMQLTDDTGWLYPTLLNGWVAYGFGYGSTIRYKRYPSGLVEIRGLVKNGIPGSDVFMLPAGFRPLEYLSINIDDSTLEIGSDGRVRHRLGITAFFSIRCLFYAG